MVKIHVRAPGKLILLGEYAVLEGAKAVVAAVDARSSISLCLTSKSSSLLHAPQIGFEHVPFQWSGSGMVWSDGIDEAVKSKLILPSHFERTSLGCLKKIRKPIEANWPLRNN